NKVPAARKTTAFKLGCRMLAEEGGKVAKEFPEVEYNEVLVDTFAAKLVMKPQDFDVVVTTNTFGDILSDAAAGLTGGLGLAAGLSAGPGRGWGAGLTGRLRLSAGLSAGPER